MGVADPLRDEHAELLPHLESLLAAAIVVEGIDDEVPTHYDLVVNTDVLSSGEAASIVVHAAG